MGRMTGLSLTAEQRAEAARIKASVLPEIEKEIELMAVMLASRSTGEFLGKTEFDLRDCCHEIGARVLQAAFDQRKKGGTKGRA